MPLWAGFLLVEFSKSIQLGFQLVEPTIAYSSERERPARRPWLCLPSEIQSSFHRGEKKNLEFWYQSGW